MSYFKNAQVGDKVFSLIAGAGEIKSIDHSWMECLFNSSMFQNFDRDGCYVGSVSQTLFYGDKAPEIILPPEPSRLPDLKLNTFMLVRTSNDHAWAKRHFKAWSQKGMAVCWSDGKTSFTTDTPIDTAPWKYWEVAKEDKL